MSVLFAYALLSETLLYENLGHLPFLKKKYSAVKTVILPFREEKIGSVIDSDAMRVIWTLSIKAKQFELKH